MELDIKKEEWHIWGSFREQGIGDLLSIKKYHDVWMSEQRDASIKTFLNIHINHKRDHFP